MSTRRGLTSRHLAPASAARLETLRNNRRVPVYRCVYCKRLLPDRFSVPAHEIQCDMKTPMLRIWAQAKAAHERRYLRDVGRV